MTRFSDMGDVSKKHNNRLSTAEKIRIRKCVLAEVQPARVLDCYCGPAGEMWRGAWSYAAEYAGIDKTWRRADPRRRFVGDSLRVLRTLELSPWNVFDVDTFGDPWTTTIVIAARRRWERGEKGAVIVTDGNELKYRSGSLPLSVQTLLSSSSSSSSSIHRGCITALLGRMNAKPLRLWEVEPKGPAAMRYSAVVFQASGR